MHRDDAAYEGQREYTPLFLTIYDPVVLGFLAPVVWRCPTARLVESYRRHLGHRHLDVGPGTGYFLARAGVPDGNRITLLDPKILEASFERVDLETLGSMAIFAAANPRRTPHQP